MGVVIRMMRCQRTRWWSAWKVKIQRKELLWRAATSPQLHPRPGTMWFCPLVTANWTGRVPWFGLHGSLPVKGTVPEWADETPFREFEEEPKWGATFGTRGKKNGHAKRQEGKVMSKPMSWVRKEERREKPVEKWLKTHRAVERDWWPLTLNSARWLRASFPLEQIEVWFPSSDAD